MIWNLLKPRPQGLEIPAAELAKKVANREPLNVIDVRMPQEYAQGHVPGARLIPLAQLGARLDEIPASRPLYVICRSGGRSAQAVRLLAGAGIEAINVTGGMLSYPGPATH